MPAVGTYTIRLRHGADERGEQSRDRGRDAVRVRTGWAMAGNEPASGSGNELRDDADERRDADVAVGDELPVHGDGRRATAA